MQLAGRLLPSFHKSPSTADSGVVPSRQHSFAPGAAASSLPHAQPMTNRLPSISVHVDASDAAGEPSRHDWPVHHAADVQDTTSNSRLGTPAALNPTTGVQVPPERQAEAASGTAEAALDDQQVHLAAIDSAAVCET